MYNNRACNFSGRQVRSVGTSLCSDVCPSNCRETIEWKWKEIVCQLTTGAGRALTIFDITVGNDTQRGYMMRGRRHGRPPSFASRPRHQRPESKIKESRTKHRDIMPFSRTTTKTNDGARFHLFEADAQHGPQSHNGSTHCRARSSTSGI